MHDEPARRRRPPTWFLIQITLIPVLAFAGLLALVGAEPIGAGFGGELEPRLGLDRLSAIFLLLICLLGVASALAGLSGRRRSGWLGFAFLLAMVLLVAARDALTFLVAWEAMSLAPAAAILVESQSRAARKGVLIYMGTTHLGGAGVWLGMLYLADRGFLAGEATEAVPLAVAIVALIGFAAKAGLAPLHFWLPRAHPLAPAPVSALMSGAMVALPLYATIRLLFEWLDPAPAGLGWGLIAAGTISGLLGAYSAAMAGEIKRLLAFSTVENIGLAAVAIGLAVVLAGAGRPGVAGLALAVAIFQLLAHGAAKSALFLAGGAIGAQVGSLDLDHLGGLGRRMPQVAAGLVLGALSLAAIPPLAGFAAEWALLQSLLAAVTGLGGGSGLVLSAVAGGIALIAGLALIAFCKLIGLTLLGEARRPACETAREPGLAIRLAIAIGAACALAIGLAAGLVLPWLESAITAPMLRAEPLSASGAELGMPGSGGLAGFGLAVALLVFGGLIWRLRGPARSAPARTWTCGQPASPRLAWSGAGFVKTLRLATSPRRRVDREAFGAGPTLRVTHDGEGPHIFEWRLHRPLLAFAIDAAAVARRLQSGRLRTYLLYLALTLIVALAAVRLGLL